jgi:4-diphosphocytidyl-2-C-methyl-D-erythritol kinase
MRLEARALAKVNLHLAVHGRRPDGYHELTTIFQSIGLADVLTVASVPGPFAIRTDAGEVPADETNLVWRAARALADEEGRDLRDIRIALHKAVPVQAGLGGGSADAAATLRALQVLWDLRPDPDRIARLGAGLGSDVSFFALGGTALGTGRGERLAALPDFPDHAVVLVRPPFGVSTAAAYAWLAEARRAEVSGRRNIAWPTRTDEWAGVIGLLGNDFEPVVGQRHPDVQEAIDTLVASGARLAVLCGSGSAVAGLFERDADARTAAGSFGSRVGWRVWSSRTVGQQAYEAAVTVTRLP